MNENREVIEVDLKRMLQALWRKAWLLVIVGVLGAALFLSYAWFFVTPMYSASTQLYVNNTYGENTLGFSSSQLSAAQDLAGTYMVILESRAVLNAVQEQTGLSYTYNKLKSMVSAAAVNETEVFQVNVTCADYKHATIIANAIADVLPEKIASVVPGSDVRVVDYAVETDRQVSPNYQRNVLLGFVAGLVLAAAFVILKELMNTTITDEDYLTQTYGEFPLLAVIPDAQNTSTSGYYKGYYEAPPKKKQPAKPEEKKKGGEK